LVERASVNEFTDRIRYNPQVQTPDTLFMSDVLQAKAFSGWHDYYEMCKPRVVLLMLLCTLVGMFLATNEEQRPVAQGRVSTAQGLVFVAVTGGLGLFILAFWVNPLTAGLNFLAWLGYGVIYSLYLKRATSQNIVIGGLFGAAPPLFGWTAVTNSVDGGGLLLVLIIFAWTPPHFWALAIDRLSDYEKVDIPMLPITHGVAYTKLHILLYTIILLVVSVLPFVIGMSNLLYLVAALALGAGFLYWALVMMFDRNPNAPMETFKYSIVYLAVLFSALLLDHYLMPTPYA
jgi:heme o synthase